MLIFYADTRGLDEGRALCRGRSRAPGSAFAYSLLRYALEVWKGAPELPEITTDGRGKPYFPERPDWHFSLSHTRGFVLAAVSAAPVGADVQLRDGRGERLAGRLMSEREREQFDFYELWSLRESLYKLTGEGSLRSLRFERRGGLFLFRSVFFIWKLPSVETGSAGDGKWLTTGDSETIKRHGVHAP